MEEVQNLQEDAAVLLAIKDAEVQSLRQQMAQLTTDLKRNLEVLGGKDNEVLQLRETVDALRGIVAGKDELFLQFQQQVQELEQVRAKEATRCAELEQQLASQQQGWQKQSEAEQQNREAEIASLKAALKQTEDKWSAQLMAARQDALDEYLRRSNQQQSQLEWAAEKANSLFQQGQSLSEALQLKEAELEGATGQLERALESLQRMEDTHKQTLAAKDSHIQELQERLTQAASSSEQSSNNHEAQLTKLVISLTEMKEAYSLQAQEVVQLTTEIKQLQGERGQLREKLREQETQLIRLQTEKEVLEGALQHEVISQASAQAELNIFKAKLTEAVVELEQRCAAAESRAGQLMGQLVEERGRLVDAVIEQANSSSPQLAAELAKSLEADRARTQAELQRAQERASSLQEDLALIRSTLLPLAQQQPTPKKGPSLAALTALQQHQLLQHQQEGSHQPAGAGARLERQQADDFLDLDDCSSPDANYTTGCHEPAASKTPCRGRNAGAACEVPIAAASCAQCSKCAVPPRQPGSSSQASLPSQWPSVRSPGVGRVCRAGSSPSRQQQQVQQQQQQQLAGQAGSPGALADLVYELQADVDKLQHQLNQSRQQLQSDRRKQEGRSPPGKNAIRCVNQESRPSTAGSLGSSVSGSWRSAKDGSPSKQQQQQLAAGEHAQGQQLADVLCYLVKRAEKLSAENGALKNKLSEAAAAPGGTSPQDGTSKRQQHREQQHGRGRGSMAAAEAAGDAEAEEERLKRLVMSAAKEYNRWQAPVATAPRPAGRPSSRGSCGLCLLSALEDDCRPAGDSSSSTISSADLSSLVRDELATAAAAGCRRSSSEHGSPSSYAAAADGRSGRGLQAAAAVSPGSISSIRGSPGRRRLREESPLRGLDTASYEGQLLESVLANWPANSRISKVIKQLMADLSEANPSSSPPPAAAAGSSSAKATLGSCSSSGGGWSSKAEGGHRGGDGGGGSSISGSAVSAKEQLRRLMQMSPIRQRLAKSAMESVGARRRI